MTDAQVHDLGYRPFEGRRAGVGWAMWSLSLHAVRRVFGLKRPARFKVMPVISLVIAFVPVLVMVGLAIFIPDDLVGEDALPSYGEYFGFVGFAVALFAAFAIPEVLTTDRRSGMLALYMASPLDRTTYVLAKFGAALSVMLTLTMFPLLILLLANTLAGTGPGFSGFFKLGIQVIAIGLLLAVYFAGLSMAVSSVTKRAGMASVAVVLVLLVPPVIVTTILDATDVTDFLAVFNFFSLPFEAARRIFGEVGDTPGVKELSDQIIIGSTAIIGLGGLVFTWWRYQSIEVDR